MRFLVTRPQPDADALCERLRAMGHAGLIDPLMSIAWLEPPRLDLDRCQAVVATSRNALRALARHPERLADLVGLPLFAVGAATADLARSLVTQRQLIHLPAPGAVERAAKHDRPHA